MQSWALEFRSPSSHQDRLNWTDLLSTPVSPVLVQTDIKASSKNRRHHSIPRRAQAGPTHTEEKKVTFINRQKYKQIINQPTNFICTSPNTETKVEWENKTACLPSKIYQLQRKSEQCNQMTINTFSEYKEQGNVVKKAQTSAWNTNVNSGYENRIHKRDRNAQEKSIWSDTGNERT